MCQKICWAQNVAKARRPLNSGRSAVNEAAAVAQLLLQSGEAEDKTQERTREQDTEVYRKLSITVVTDRKTLHVKLQNRKPATEKKIEPSQHPSQMPTC